MIIETKRFILKNITISDVSPMYVKWFHDKNIKKYINSSLTNQTISTLKKYIKDKNKKSNVIFLAIFTKKNNEHIGNIKFEPFNKIKKETTMGIMIGNPKWRGKGVVKEVLTTTSKKLYIQYGILRIYLGVNKKNTNAIKAYKKSGFLEYKRNQKNSSKNLEMVLFINSTNRLSIGTAQFGIKDYGINNKLKNISLNNIKSILNTAEKKGINSIDTARMYGNSEFYLGKFVSKKWHISTKIPPIPDKCLNLGNWVKNTFNESLNFLKLKKIDTLLLHHPNDLLGNRGLDLYKSIQNLKNKGFIKKFGISLYNINNFKKFTDQYKIDVIQTPFNLVDRRLLKNGLIYRIKDAGIDIHIRSVFLQGLLLMDSKLRLQKFKQWKKIWNNFDIWIKELNVSPIEACIGYVLSFPEIDKIIVGVENKYQLLDISSAKKIIDTVPVNISTNDRKLINPYNWNIS